MSCVALGFGLALDLRYLPTILLSSLFLLCLLWRGTSGA